MNKTNPQGLGRIKHPMILKELELVYNASNFYTYIFNIPNKNRREFSTRFLLTVKIPGEQGSSSHEDFYK